MSIFAKLITIAFYISDQSFGFRIHSKQLKGRIVGGTDTTLNEFPYQLSLLYYEHHACGASILSETVALTAAHCIDTSPRYAYAIRYGSSLVDIGGIIVYVIEVQQHPLFSQKLMDYDVSVILLHKPITEGTAIDLQPANQVIPVGTNAVVTGWGDTAKDEPVVVLQKVIVAHVDHATCSEMYKSKLKVTPRMTCYAAPNKDACTGDSGGPLVVNGKQVGIVSWGYKCALINYPGVYTNVANSEIHRFITIHKDWQNFHIL